MARLPRIEIAGFYHVINRGEERRQIFIDKEDYEKFSITYSYGILGELREVITPTALLLLSSSITKCLKKMTF